MSLKKLLQGAWLGHPLHPAMVHLPTGLWPSALVFDLVSRFGDGSNAAVVAALGCIVIGLGAALAAVPTGLADWVEIKPEKPARTLGWWHMGLNIAVAALMTISLILRLRDGLDTVRVSMAALLLALLANAILMVSGYLGGRMVYEHGISVARESKKKWRKIAEEGHARLPAQ
jgi:uncharacterized membrane protein